MSFKSGLVTASFLALPLAMISCLKSPEETTGNTDIKSGLDAQHGGVRLALPDIDPAALNKRGKDTAVIDTLVQDSTPRAWFELSITADNMQEMFFQFPIIKKAGGQSLEITGIPSGKGRHFHGRLFNRNWQLTHEGVAISDIQPGTFTPIRLYLAKASGSADLCVVIEGQKLPPCAVDTLPPIDSPSWGSIPLPGEDSLTTLCFEMRLNYLTGCELSGYAKLNFLAGQITGGNLNVAAETNRHYLVQEGYYDSTAIHFFARTPDHMSIPHDTLIFDGWIGGNRDIAKGEYRRWPSGSEATWFMQSVPCGEWKPTYPDSSCFLGMP